MIYVHQDSTRQQGHHHVLTAQLDLRTQTETRQLRALVAVPGCMLMPEPGCVLVAQQVSMQHQSRRLALIVQEGMQTRTTTHRRCVRAALRENMQQEEPPRVSNACLAPTYTSALTARVADTAHRAHLHVLAARSECMQATWVPCAFNAGPAHQVGTLQRALQLAVIAQQDLQTTIQDRRQSVHSAWWVSTLQVGQPCATIVRLVDTMMTWTRPLRA